MSKRQNSDPLKNTFPFPNEIFILGLRPGELAVYSYLLCCANRKTNQCWPSYKTIGTAVGMSRKTVQTHIGSLISKGLIQAEETMICRKNGRRYNGSLRYTVTPIRQVLKVRENEFLEQLKLAEAQRKWASTQQQA